MGTVGLNTTVELASVSALIAAVKHSLTSMGREPSVADASVVDAGHQRWLVPDPALRLATPTPLWRRRSA